VRGFEVRTVFSLFVFLVDEFWNPRNA